MSFVFRTITLLVFCTGALVMANDLKIGDKAPEFNLKSQDGKSYSLSDYKGKWVALYFYPKDNTPGCTKEAKNIRDNKEKIARSKVEIFGISVDSETSHQEFAQELELNFPILSDPTKDITKKYGVLSFLGIAKRETFIIKPDQTIGQILKDVDVSNHTEEILAAIEKLKAIK